MNIDSIQAEHRAMQRVAAALLRHPHDAEDAVQDAWVAALSSADAPEGRGWFTVVVRRLSWARRSAPAALPLDEEPRSGSTSAEAGSRSAAAVRLAAAVDALPPHYREVIERRYWDDEPPRQIARHLGLEVKTVQNRLHRAHVQLRRALVAEDARGARGACAMLLTLVRREDALLASGAAGAIAPLTVIATAAALLGALMAGWTLNAGTGSDAGDAEAIERAAAPARSEGVAGGLLSSPLELAAADAPPERSIDAQRQSVPMAPDAASVDSTSEAPVVPTVPVSLQVVDGTSGDPVERFTLLLRDGAREDAPFDAVPSEVLAEEGLPAGAYDLAVRARGYDDRDLGRVSVQAPDGRDLGRVALDRGSATLEARALGVSNASGLVLGVTSLGRWPCPSCADAPRGLAGTHERCVECGFDGKETLHVLEPGRDTAWIERLVAGPVRVVLSDHADGTVLASASATLQAASVTTLELRVEAKDVLVELVDAEGQPFDGAWPEAGSFFRAPITFQIWSGDLLSAVAGVDPVDLGERLRGNPDGRLILRTRGDLMGSTEVPRARTALERLWPDSLPLPSGLQPARVEVRRVEDGLYRLVGVPTTADAVQVASGPFVELPHALEDGVDGVERVRIVVDERCGAPSRQILMMEGVTCTSCHVAQGM
ncbi:MAG: RNA polymerase sigma factor [Planctomycetota bacterium]